jgi:arylsulfatase A-like enzyme
MTTSNPNRLSAPRALRAHCQLIAVAVAGCLIGATLTPRPARGAGEKPKLVVLLAVDQLRADYVDMYGGNWKYGLRRLLDKGAYYTNARYPYVATVTCPGHSTLGTGAYPHTHGMVLNAWWDRERKRLVECTDDPSTPLVAYGAGRAAYGDSAHNLLVPTLADEMKQQLTPKARSVSFSMKARSAIGLVGHTPDAATWHEGGVFVTSKAFTAEPLPWLQKALDAHPREPALATSWDRLLPESAYKFADDVPEERPPTGWKRTFPHELKFTPPPPRPAAAAADGARVIPPSRFSLWEKSPWADAYLAMLATSAVDALGLGQGEGTDFLAVSFSILDIVGHPYGPRSHEVQDVLARLDVTVGELLEHLDKKVGAGKYVVGLSADHGVAVYPEQSKAEGEDAGRVSSTDMKKRIGDALVAELGPGAHMSNHLYTDVYLAPGVYDKLKQKPGAIDRILAAIKAAPGVAAAYSLDDLADAGKAKASKDPLRYAAALSYYPGRSGDLVLMPKRNWLTTSLGTTHGTQHDYDQHVPVVLFGAGIKPGKYQRAVSPADLAPTFAQVLGVKLAKAEGAPLAEALLPAGARVPAAKAGKAVGKASGKASKAVGKASGKASKPGKAPAASVAKP